MSYNPSYTLIDAIASAEFPIRVGYWEKTSGGCEFVVRELNSDEELAEAHKGHLGCLEVLVERNKLCL